MSTDPVSTFEQSLQGTSTVHTTTAASLGETVDGVIAEPAVGTPLPFDGVSLSGTPVATEFAPSDLRAAATGVTPAGLGIATYGTITVRSRTARDELVALYPERHVAILAASDVVSDMATAYEELSEEFEWGVDTQVLATGPSATADMGTLVEGVHGPKETHVVLLEDR
jgi:L-lactate dehydrogenase complex protein LldG